MEQLTVKHTLLSVVSTILLAGCAGKSDLLPSHSSSERFSTVIGQPIDTGVILAPGTGTAQLSYSSSEGFSSTQGANQWSYLDGDNVPMVYDATYAGGSWHSTTPTDGDLVLHLQNAAAPRQ